MVKVQKPTPKRLSKLAKMKNSVNKKKDIKSKVAAPAEGAPSNKNKKAKLIKAIVKEEHILPQVKVKPVKSEKKSKDKMRNTGESVVSVQKLMKKDKSVKNKKAATQKRPAVSAPPSSPTATSDSAAGKSKKKTNKAKVTPNAVPAPATSPIQKKNQNKKSRNVRGKAIQTAHVTPKSQEQQLTKKEKKKAAIRAYNKQQKHKKLVGNEMKDPPNAPEYSYEPVPFDEDKFKAIVCVDNIKKIAEALKVLVEKEVAQKKTAIFSDYKYCLNVASFQIPSCPKRVVKLSLKHSLVDKEDDVVIIVSDLKRGSKVDYEPTIQHYEDLFREAGVEGLKIMPFNQLRTEYTSYEALRKLANTYDYFLCDGRLSAAAVEFCGSLFQKPRLALHAVRMDTPHIKREIEKSMHRTAFKQLHKGDLISIPVGTHKFTSQQLAENVDHVVAKLATLHPGGLGNVRSMYLKIALNGTSSLPIYISMAQPPLETPYVIGKREKRMLKMKKEANEVLAKFAMTKDAKILKLTGAQITKKMKIKKAKEELAAIPETSPEGDDDFRGPALPCKKAKRTGKTEDKDSKILYFNEQAPKDDGDDGKGSAVSDKKSRKEESVDVEDSKRNADEQGEPEPDGVAGSEDESDADDYDYESDDDMVEEAEEEEDQAPENVEEGDDDDDDNEDDDDDDESDDDEEQEDNVNE